MSNNDPKHDDSQWKELAQRVYPEDERLREIADNPDRRMTRAEWEREERAAREAAHKKRQQVQQDREIQQDHDKKKQTQHRNWKKILLWTAVGVAVLLVVFLIGYIPHHDRQKKAAAAAREREHEEPQVSVMQVRHTQAPGQLTVPGTTAALTEAYIYARANGYLRKRFVDIGDHVKKGQLLALIDAPDLDAQVAQAREQLRQAEAQQAQQQAQLDLNRVTWERWRTLVAKGVFSRQDGDQREADFLAQQAVVASAQRNVESYRANLQRVLALQEFEKVTAPFDGVVTQRNSDVGALVGSSGAASAAPSPSAQQPVAGSANQGNANTSGSSGQGSQAATPMGSNAQGGPLFAIAQINTLRILVSVPEGYASSLRPGMPARVYVQERAKQPIEGKVVRTANSLDQNTRTMLTEVDVSNKDGALYPGMYAVVTFVQVRGTPPITVPGDAVVVRQDRNMVAVVRDEKVQMVPVEIGRDYGPAVEILSGLKEGDWIITTVTDDVQPGRKVRPQISKDAAQQSGQTPPQTQQAPDSGPNEYGDQSIVNSKSESTNQQGKQQGQGQQKQQQQKGASK